MRLAPYQRDYEVFAPEPEGPFLGLQRSEPPIPGWTEVGGSPLRGLGEVRTASSISMMYLESLTAHGSPKLRRFTKVELTASDDGVEIFAPALRVGGFGSTLRAAVDDLSDTVLSIWQELSATPRDQLDQRAGDLRDRLASLFE